MARELGLSLGPKTSIEAVLKERDEKVFALEKDIREKRAALRANTLSKILGILTPLQRELYEKGRWSENVGRLHDQSPGRYRGGGLHED